MQRFGELRASVEHAPYKNCKKSTRSVQESEACISLYPMVFKHKEDLPGTWSKPHCAVVAQVYAVRYTSFPCFTVLEIFVHPLQTMKGHAQMRHTQVVFAILPSTAKFVDWTQRRPYVGAGSNSEKRTVLHKPVGWSNRTTTATRHFSSAAATLPWGASSAHAERARHAPPPPMRTTRSVFRGSTRQRLPAAGQTSH